MHGACTLQDVPGVQGLPNGFLLMGLIGKKWKKFGTLVKVTKTNRSMSKRVTTTIISNSIKWFLDINTVTAAPESEIPKLDMANGYNIKHLLQTKPGATLYTAMEFHILALIIKVICPVVAEYMGCFD